MVLEARGDTAACLLLPGRAEGTGLDWALPLAKVQKKPGPQTGLAWPCPVSSSPLAEAPGGELLLPAPGPVGPRPEFSDSSQGVWEA